MDLHDAYHFSNIGGVDNFEKNTRESCCSVCLRYNNLSFNIKLVRNGKGYYFKQICGDCKNDLEYLFYSYNFL